MRIAQLPAAGWLVLLLCLLILACGPGKTAEDYTQSGREALQAKQYDQAIASFSEALKLDPKSVKAYNNRGIAYCEKGDYPKAIADFTRVVEIDPKNGKGFNNRAVAHWLKGEPDHALQDLTRAQGLGIAVDPQFLESVTQAISGKKK